MKKWIFLAYALLAGSLAASAQRIDLQVLASGGGIFTAATGEQVQFTIGQPYLTYTLDDTENADTATKVYMTQGFQQPTFIEQLMNSDWPTAPVVQHEIAMYPNPAVNYTDITLDILKEDGVQITLVDLWGQELNKKDYQVEIGKRTLRFTFGYVATGMYTLKIRANDEIVAKKLMVASGGSVATSL